jgi:hypothetical protein
MIRWFSGYNQVHEDEASSLLDSLTNVLCNSESNGAERDLCYKGFTEFFMWAIRQTSKKEMRLNPISVDLLLSRILTLLAHPKTEQRFTAASILKKIYKYFREESSLVYKYSMRILYLLLQVLKQDNTPAAKQVGISAQYEICIFLIC